MRSRWWFKIFLFIFYRDPWKHEMIQFDIGHIFVEVFQPPARVGAFERGEGSFGSATSLKNPQQSCFEQKNMEVGTKNQVAPGLCMLFVWQGYSR